MSESEIIYLIERCAALIGEHGNVQILVSIPVDKGGTKGIKRGCGDWYARQGLAQEFIQQDRAQNIGEEVARRIDPPDDGEAWKHA